jgi:hypothetical protein
LSFVLKHLPLMHLYLLHLVAWLDICRKLFL